MLQKNLDELSTKYYHGQYCYENVKNVVNMMPTLDIPEVKRAEWIEGLECCTTFSGKKYKTYYECSLCGRHENFQKPYCHCGARMDGWKG